MKKYIVPFSLLLFLGILVNAPIQAQEFKQFPIQFERMANRPFNDTMMVFRLRVSGTDEQGQSLVGTISLGLCSCYCDSLWDAWPDCYPDCFKGNGTLGYIEPTISFSSSSGDSVGPTGPLKGRGTLGIRQMEGGILREKEFSLPIKYSISIE